MTDTKVTQYGFTWGPAHVVRVCSDKKHGVWLVVMGKREQVEIRVTNAGNLRVWPVEKRAFNLP